MSCLVTPTDASTSSAASIRRSSRPLSKCSRNGVHDMPTMATRSLMPFRSDVLLGDAHRCQHLVGRVDQEIVAALVEVLPERGARHADDGDAVLDAIQIGCPAW